MPEVSLQRSIEQIGAEIFSELGRATGREVFSRKWLYHQLMEWSMRDEHFKTQLFRFVDVLPSLAHPQAVLEHLREYLVQPGLPLQKMIGVGLQAGQLSPPLTAWVVRKNVQAMANLFIVGRDESEALPELRSLWKKQVRFTVDILGETVVSDREADETARRYLRLLEALAVQTKDWRAEGKLGLTEPPLVNVSVKISALCARINGAAPETTIRAIRSRLDPIFRRARELGVFINLDMESYAVKDLTLRLFRELFEDEENCPACGCVVQAYLRDSEQDLVELLDWVEARGRRITVRLVKGAYWDYERIIARQRDWPVPVFESKAATDANYERLTRILLERRAIVYPAFATHNVRSIAHALATAENLGAQPGEYEFQALYGMAAAISRTLVARGHRVREYCPVGELLPGMAYLVRRLLENTSNEGFLRALSGKTTDRLALLAAPVAELEAAKPRAAFTNHPPLDFAKAEERMAMQSAIQMARQALAGEVLPVIEGKAQGVSEFLSAANPAAAQETFGRVGLANMAQADQAVAAAQEVLPKWLATSTEKRAAWLLRVADLLAARRVEFAALQVLEVGKNWAEADADVCEAIDFCRFYAEAMPDEMRPRLTQKVAGEVSLEEHFPRGVGLIVAPWNFPLAILCGMTVAALVCGNTVVIKPAEQSSHIAARFHAILLEAGLPPSAAAFLPGRGESVGAHLAQHSGVHFVAFTGSKEVGLQIWENAARSWPGQRHLRTVVCEMGGKNPLIIDADADLDEAVAAILHSAFGFQGQKCSALSRLIVLQPIYELLVQRLVEAAAALKMGAPKFAENDLGPVIDEEARKKILGLIEEGKAAARLVFQSADVPTAGWFVPLTIFADVPPSASIFRKEIFGPVLCITSAKDLEEAIALANDTEFALTAGLFSRSPGNIERARRELQAGNIYINRSITGAIVERHPFGGFGMSGSGTKAGGRAYLKNFLLPKVVTENTMRRGFSPDES